MRELRESKKLDLKTISQHTKISATMLEALEEENFKILPKKAYIRGFVKSFVKTLGGDQKEAIKIVEATHRYYFPEEYETSEEEEDILQGPEISNPSIVKGVLLGLALLSVVAIGIFLVVSQQTSEKAEPSQKASKTQKESPEKTADKEDVEPTSISPDTPLKTQTPTTESEEKFPKKVGEQVIAQNQQDQEKETPSAQQDQQDQQEQADEKENQDDEEEKDEEVTLRPITRDLYSYAEVDHQEQVEEFIPEQMRTIIPNKENLFIRATEGDTWLAYKADDKEIKSFTLQEGEFILIRASTIRIFFGNVKATKLFLNNKLITTPSRTGVKSLVFPEDKKDQFMIPLFIFKENGEVITSEEYQKRQQEAGED